MIHNHSSGKCRSVKRFLAVCMAVVLICMLSLNCIAAETDESVSETFTEETPDSKDTESEKTEEPEEETTDVEIKNEETGEEVLKTEPEKPEEPVQEKETEEPEETELDLEEDTEEIEVQQEISENTEDGQAVALLSDGTEELNISKVEILDSIRQEGCLYIKVTDQNGSEITAEQLTEAGYEIIWLGNKQEVRRKRVTGDSYNLAQDGSWLNVTLDQGAQKNYQVQIKKDGQEIVQSESYQVPYYDSLRNGSFEIPACTTQYQPFITGDTGGIIWKTTASDKRIEIVSAASDKMDGNATHQSLSEDWHGMSAAAQGTQYAELNANEESSLYQDVLTTPGSTMHWQLYHAARLKNGGDSYEGSDEMYVVIMDAELAEKLSRNQNQLVKVAKALAAGTTMVDGVDYSGAGSFFCTSNTGAWMAHNGSYKVPDGQYLTRYFFVSADSASGDNSIGNHIDNVWFSTELPPANPDLTAVIHIRKQVEGPMGDVKKDFSFSYRYLKEDSTWATGEFSLKDYDEENQIFTISGIPVSTRLFLTEKNAEGYTTTASYNGQAVSEVEGDSEDQEKSLQLLVREGEGDLTVTNFKDVIPDMGVEILSWPFEILMILVMAGSGLLFLKKHFLFLPGKRL